MFPIYTINTLKGVRDTALYAFCVSSWNGIRARARSFARFHLLQNANAIIDAIYCRTRPKLDSDKIDASFMLSTVYY